MPDDAELLRLYAEERSETAFTELVRRHLGLVYSAALRQLDGASHRAEDVTQSVFVDLARNAAALSRRSEIVGWLYTSTRFAALALKRAEARREKRERDAHAMHEINAGTAENWEHIRPVLDQVMNELAEPDRIAILMRFFENGCLADVGQRIGLSEDAARMRIDRALDRLRLRLQRRGISSTQAALAGMLTTQAVLAVPLPLFAKVASTATLGAATVTASSGILVPFWTSMTASKTIVGASGIVALLSLGTATFEMSKVAALESNVEALRKDVSELTTSRDNFQVKSIELSKALDVARAGDVSRTAAVSNGAPAQPASRAVATPVTAADLILRSAEHMALRSKLDATKIGPAYAPFYRKMNLAEDQIHEFERLMSAQLNRGHDVASATWLAGFRAGDPEYAAAMQKHTADTTAALTRWIEDNLGPSGGTQLTDFNRAKPLHELVRALAADTFDSSTPLTAAQGDRLVALLSQSDSSYRKGHTATVVDVDWDAVTTGAAAFLSEEQLSALRRVRDQKMLNHQMVQLSQRLQRQADQNNAKK
jgi:RNA polymerase sigma factor (sigma-70 family)